MPKSLHRRPFEGVTWDTARFQKHSQLDTVKQGLAKALEEARRIESLHQQQQQAEAEQRLPQLNSFEQQQELEAMLEASFAEDMHNEQPQQPQQQQQRRQSRRRGNQPTALPQTQNPNIDTGQQPKRGKHKKRKGRTRNGRPNYWPTGDIDNVQHVAYISRQEYAAGLEEAL